MSKNIIFFVFGFLAFSGSTSAENEIRKELKITNECSAHVGQEANFKIDAEEIRTVKVRVRNLSGTSWIELSAEEIYNFGRLSAMFGERNKTKSVNLIRE